ncbi:MAG: hypothetical protein AAF718_16490 [Pseudomonadota bacterium]
MDIQNYSVTGRYDLDRLGLLDLPPLKAAAIVTETAFDILQPTAAAFVVFDEGTGEAVLQAVSRRFKAGTRYAMYASALSDIRENGETISATDLANDTCGAPEYAMLGMGSVLAAPVLGPDQYPIGALTVFDQRARIWPQMDHTRLENLAYLITQEVILRASFATLELMAVERSSLRARV